MAVFAPMPNASVSTATAVKPGFFSNWRKANFKSFTGGRGNIEHRTSKVESVACPRLRCSAFDVGCSMFVLFITQRLHRIDSRRPSRRHPAGEQRHARKRQRDYGEGERISRTLWPMIFRSAPK